MDRRIQELRRQAAEDPTKQWALYRAMRQAGLLHEYELPEHAPRINQWHVDEIIAYLGPNIGDGIIVEMLEFPGECWDDPRDEMYESPQLQVVGIYGDTYLTAMTCIENRSGELVPCYETSIWASAAPPEVHNHLSNQLHYDWQGVLKAAADYVIGELVPITAEQQGVSHFTAETMLRQQLPHNIALMDSFYEDEEEYPDPPATAPEHDEYMIQQMQAQYHAEEEQAYQAAIDNNECRICNDEINRPNVDICIDCEDEWGSFGEYQQSMYEGDD